jgi:tellurite methyltransferase
VDDQKEYWEHFYDQHQAVEFPSPFAVFCTENFLGGESRILELGSGNGRDSLFFSENGHTVVAVDHSAAGVALSRQSAINGSSPGSTEFKEGDFTRLDAQAIGEVDTVYSRFSLHAIDASAEQRVIDFAWETLSPGGLFLIEARTVNDPLHGEGTRVGPHEYVTDHYRRYLDAQELLSRLQVRGFRLVFFRESSGLAVFKDQDPVVVRLALARP